MNRAIELTQHALDRAVERGVSAEDVRRALDEGDRGPVRRGLRLYRWSSRFEREWARRSYDLRHVAAVVADDAERSLVVTVYAFYSGEREAC